MSDPRQIAALVNNTAAEVWDRYHFDGVGIFRQGSLLLVELAARVEELEARLAELRNVADATPDGCRGCGAPLEQPDVGRPRKWCSDRCRRKWRKPMMGS